jgi:hypothetical protein
LLRKRPLTFDWKLDADALAAIGQILRQAIPNPSAPNSRRRRRETPTPARMHHLPIKLSLSTRKTEPGYQW